MKQLLTSMLLALRVLSFAGHTNLDGVRIPVIKYNPATFLSDIERALANPDPFECLSADSHQLASMAKQ